ncbi:hypothetical protein MKZ38_010618 [Zalerion maritima]|uniref:tRNA pseudouridine synthase 1 n=1 Tax=Zalerion maritima TaxID=339359 RepID=A0AAD5S0C5_9PEZI|nr:hypothetical protein MKZ38_010618 [Zalerion maritima]
MESTPASTAATNAADKPTTAHSNDAPNPTAKHRDRGNRKNGDRNQSSKKRRNDGKDKKQSDMKDGRGSWNRKRRRVDDPDASNWGVDKKIKSEDIDNEERRPKRKVAVMIGYAGTGYKGMQISKTEKTIEGDIFAAFIASNAVSKANADDPRKSSFVRCARTDKGVHAAGNVISLKLIDEDPDIVDKINEKLPDQIRIWGIQRTNKSFSCYKACDSRWYEYLMPSYCLIPPHPDSFLAKNLIESAKREDKYDEFAAGMEDLKDFWTEVDEKHVKPLLAKMDRKTREGVMARLNSPEDFLDGHVEKGRTPTPEPQQRGGDVEMVDAAKAKLTAVDFGYKAVKNAVVAAKRAYRVSPERLQRLQGALDKYCGTKNFYNYTIQKTFRDKSAHRHIKSFVVNPEPIQINDTQWLSLKVHGQSFMMHQIRKMVAMAVLCTRCNTPLSRIDESYEDSRISIPKAPGVGLLLERPVFDHHNEKMTGAGIEREAIDFSQWEDKIRDFKQKHIYQRMWDVEEADAPFHTFFNQIDNFDTGYFLWLTAKGIPAALERNGPSEAGPNMLDDADDNDVGDRDAEGGEG